MAAYIKGLLALVLLVTVLLHLPPGNSYRRYIRFFAELLLMLALLTPVLSLLGDGEVLLEQIAYEEFSEERKELAQDMQNMEYLYGDYHKRAYEKAIAQDVTRMAEGYAFTVKEAEVQLSDAYAVEQIRLWILPAEVAQAAMERGAVEKDMQKGTGEMVCMELRQELMEFYGLATSQIQIQYGDG